MKILTMDCKPTGLLVLLLAYLIAIFSPLAHSADAKKAFDHDKTGFILKDVHATLKCEQCHVQGIFKTTPKDCAGCHATGTRVGATPKPINHVATSSPCDTCHISAANFLVKSYQHVGITGDCATCHNGQSLGVVSKATNHFPTQAPCEYCHKNTSTFLSYQVDHIALGYTGNCYTCHGGPEAGAATYPNVKSYPANHIAISTGADCNACHTNYISFLGATFTHDSTTTACSTCHKGQYPGVVSINPSVHIPIAAAATECTACHANPVIQPVPTFLGIAFHTTSYGSSTAVVTANYASCATCHNGSYTSQLAQAVGATHIPTGSLDCSACHTDSAGTPVNNTSGFTTFLAAKFHLTANGSLATITQPASTCSACHSGSYTSEGAQAKNTGHTVTSLDCVSCHTQTNTSVYTTFLGASFSHVPGAYPTTFPADGTTASPTCSSCHNGTTATGKVAGHIGTSLDCNSGGCHTVATDGCPTCVNFSGVVYNHIPSAFTAISTTSATFTSPATSCGYCHNGSTLLAQPVSTGHIPTQGADCITCHTPTNTSCGPSGGCSTFLGATFHTTSLGSTAAAAGTCTTCHNGSYTTQNAQAVGATHIPTGSLGCQACHTDATGTPSNNTANFTSFTGATVKFHLTTYGSGSTITQPVGTCSTCHGGGYTSEGAQGENSGHVVTTSDCVVCHTSANTTNYTSFLGAGYNHVPTPYATFPTGTPAPSPTCASCHNGVTATGTNANHPSIGSSDCMTCHTTSYLVGCPTCTSFGMPSSVVHSGAPYNTPGNCVTCHNGATATGISTGHIPVTMATSATAGCDQCHSVYDGVNSINFSTTATSTITVSGTSKYGMKHSAVTGRCDSCHNGSYTGQGTFGALNKVSNHIPTTIISTAANTDCTSCHSTTITVVSGAADWATGEIMNHNSDQGGSPNYCVTCHLKGVSYLDKAQLVSHNGASTSKDCSSSGCHKPLGSKGTAYSSWN